MSKYPLLSVLLLLESFLVFFVIVILLMPAKIMEPRITLEAIAFLWFCDL